MRPTRALPLLLAALASSAGAVELVTRRTPALEYPADAAGEAELRVEIEIDEAGRVAQARVVERIPAEASPSFEPAALAFARGVEFEPVVVDGEPRRVRSELRLRFAPPVPGTAAGGAQTAGPPEGGAPPEPADDPGPAAEPQDPFVAYVRASRAPVSASDLHVHVGQLADVPRKSAAELLTLAPGILLANHGGEGHASAVFLRGFDAREGQDVEFRLEGMPINDVSNAHGHGYADTHFIIPELVDEVRVLEGPFDPRQGDFAVAGSAEYHLGLHHRGSELLVGYGSFGTRRLLALWGPEGEQPGTFAGVDLRQGDGFGSNRAHASAALLAQYEAVLGERTRLFVLGQSYAARFDSAGVLREDDFAAGRLPCGTDADARFFCTYDPRQGGASSRHGVVARLVRRNAASTLEQQFFFSTRSLTLRENLTGFLLDRPPAGGVQRGDGIEQAYEARVYGLKGGYQLRRPWLGRRHDLELGYFARFDEGTSAARRLRRFGGEPYARLFDHDLRVGNLGVYGAATLRLLPGLSFRGGLRTDTFAYSLTDRMRRAADREGVREPQERIEAFGVAVQPRVSAQVRLTPGLDWVTSWGTGARSSDAAALSDGELAPFARVQAGETGLVLETAGGEKEAWTLGARATSFLTHVDRDLVFDEVSGRNSFAGASNRFGGLLQARLALGTWLEVQGSVTYTEAYLRAGDAAPWELTAGERMPYIPRWVSRFDGSVRRTLAVSGQELATSFGLGLTHVAPRPLPLGQFGEPVFLADAAARVRWRALELGLSVRNLFDARWRQAELNYPSNFADPAQAPSLRAARHFIAGEPRTLFLTLALHFGSVPEQPHDDVHEEEPHP